MTSPTRAAAVTAAAYAVLLPLCLAAVWAGARFPLDPFMVVMVWLLTLTLALIVVVSGAYSVSSHVVVAGLLTVGASYAVAAAVPIPKAVTAAGSVLMCLAITAVAARIARTQHSPDTGSDES